MKSTVLEGYAKKIYKIIDSEKGFRFNELKDLVVTNKGICSDRIFREKLKELVEKNFVKKIEIEKQHVIYTTDFQLTPLQGNDMNRILEIIPQFNEAINEIKVQKTKNKKLDAAQNTVDLIKHLAFLEMQLKIMNYVSPTKNITKSVIEIEKIKNSLLELITKDSKYEFTKFTTMVYMLISAELFSNMDQFGEEFGRMIKNSLKKI